MKVDGSCLCGAIVHASCAKRSRHLVDLDFNVLELDELADDRIDRLVDGFLRAEHH